MQGLALEEGHGVPEPAGRLARVVDRQDVWMLESRSETDLSKEPLGPKLGRQLGMEDLERDGTIVPDVVGQVDHRHAAAAELTLERVAVAERGGQGGARHVSHGRAL